MILLPLVGRQAMAFSDPWQSALRISALGVIGSPFEAQCEEITTDRVVGVTTKTVSTIYRASNGSVRIERFTAGISSQSADIYSASSKMLYRLDVTNHIVLISAREDEFFDPSLSGGDLSSSAAGWRFYTGSPVFTDERRVIEGLLCRRVRAGSPESDLWWSDELHLAVSDRYVRGGKEYVVRFSNIKRSEPSSALFSVPDDYTR
jgi:hypothetical protein